MPLSGVAGHPEALSSKRNFLPKKKPGEKEKFILDTNTQKMPCPPVFEAGEGNTPSRGAMFTFCCQNGRRSVD